MNKKENNKNVSDEEKIARAYVNVLQNLQDSTLLFTRFYDKQCSFLLSRLYNLKENEPFKFFKKAHREWERSVQKLQNEYENTFSKYLEECQELEKIMNLWNIEE